MIAVVSHKKDINVAPSYAYIIEDVDDNGFTYQSNDRYSIVWFKQSKFYAYNEPCEENEVEFINEGIWGGYIRRFVKTNNCDKGHNTFTYIYYPKTKDLYCIALNADEARFGGIVIIPAS